MAVVISTLYSPKLCTCKNEWDVGGRGVRNGRRRREIQEGEDICIHRADSLH